MKFVDRIRCCECGRFSRGEISYTPWETGYDLDPPDPLYFCAPCWAAMDADRRYLVNAAAWVASKEIRDAGENR